MLVFTRNTKKRQKRFMIFSMGEIYSRGPPGNKSSSPDLLADLCTIERSRCIYHISERKPLRLQKVGATLTGYSVATDVKKKPTVATHTRHPQPRHPHLYGIVLKSLNFNPFFLFVKVPERHPAIRQTCL